LGWSLDDLTGKVETKSKKFKRKLDAFGDQLGVVVKTLDKVVQKLDNMAPKPK